MVRHLSLAALLLGALITLAGIAIYWDTMDQTRWIKTPGKVITSALEIKVDRTPGETGSRQKWIPVVSFSYDYEGKSYVGDRYASGPPSTPSQDGQQPSAELNAIVAQYAPGSAIEVFVNPGDPAEAVIKAYTKPSWMVLVIGLVVLLAAGSGLLLHRLLTLSVKG